MTIKQMKYLSKIVACKSMTQAAKELFISQPSLSKAIKDLEEELGIKIFIRSSQGLTLSAQGQTLLSHAQIILEQTALIESHFSTNEGACPSWSISTQHYAFVIEAFIKAVNTYKQDDFCYHLREQETLHIIDDVKKGHSEIGVIYLSQFNSPYLLKILKENNLTFNQLLETGLHVFVASDHPLASKKSVNFAQLQDYHFLAFEQGEHNSFYLCEEIIGDIEHKKTIYVTDRATLFDLVVGLKGYTICSGILNTDPEDSDIVAIKLETSEHMVIGWISRNDHILSDFSMRYLDVLQKILNQKQA